MLFNSSLFLFVFLPLVLAGFFLIGRGLGRLASMAWLLMASVVFYASWEPAYLWLLLASLFFNFAAARWIGYAKWGNQAVMVSAVVGNVLLLLYYKVVIAGLIDSERGVTSSFSTSEDVLIPLAISFITFQQIAFIVDTYRGRLSQTGVLEYCLFIVFFPQLVMGPIVHYRELIPQFRSKNLCVWRWNSVALGLSIFIVGLFKKVVLADGISPYVDSVYATLFVGQGISPLDAFGVAVGFQLQIYFDFSGYADMAVGLARMFNINLPINFDSPYRAVNRFDFWRRWHISFGAFMRQYLFFPLARSRRLRLGSTGALLVTTFVSGVWHGVGPTFIVWGGIQGLLMVMLHYRGELLGRIGWKGRFALFNPWLSIFSTFCVTGMLGVFFRSRDLEVAFAVFERMYDGILLLTSGAFYSFVFDMKLMTRYDAAQILLMAVVVWGLPSTQRFFKSYWTAIDQRSHVPQYTPKDLLLGASRLRFQPTRSWAVVFALMFFVAIAFMDRTSRFIYFQF
ncbi:MAG: MBOAT family O-acyltransferase [Candidatus Sedimenticola sp. (ex Thyasira tokunagai)]